MLKKSTEKNVWKKNFGRRRPSGLVSIEIPPADGTFSFSFFFWVVVITFGWGGRVQLVKGYVILSPLDSLSLSTTTTGSSIYVSVVVVYIDWVNIAWVLLEAFSRRDCPRVHTQLLALFFYFFFMFPHTSPYLFFGEERKKGLTSRSSGCLSWPDFHTVYLVCRLPSTFHDDHRWYIRSTENPLKGRRRKKLQSVSSPPFLLQAHTL